MRLPRPLVRRCRTCPRRAAAAACAGRRRVAGLRRTPRRPSTASPTKPPTVDPLLAGSGIAHAVVAETFVTALDAGGQRRFAGGCGSTPRGPGAAARHRQEERPSGRVRRRHRCDARHARQPRRGPGPVRPAQRHLRARTTCCSWSSATTTACRCCACRAAAARHASAARTCSKPYGMWLRPSGERPLRRAGHRRLHGRRGCAGQRDRAGAAALEGAREALRGDRRGRRRCRPRWSATVGDTSAAGAIRVPESVWGDVAHERLLIAEEDLPTGTAIREYGWTDSSADARWARACSRRRPKASRCGSAPTAAATGSPPTSSRTAACSMCGTA